MKLEVGSERWLLSMKIWAEGNMHWFHDNRLPEERKAAWGDDYNIVEELRKKRRKVQQP